MLKPRRKREPEENFEEFHISPDEPVFTSGVVCRLLDIPIWVLKQLDYEEIVKPPREENCSRFYSLNELKMLKKIWYYMSERRVKVEALKVVLEMESRIESLEEKLEEDD